MGARAPTAPQFRRHCSDRKTLGQLAAEKLFVLPLPTPGVNLQGST